MKEIAFFLSTSNVPILHLCRKENSVLHSQSKNLDEKDILKIYF
jgi:hypothetical protein